MGAGVKREEAGRAGYMVVEGEGGSKMPPVSGLGFLGLPLWS